MLTAPAPADSRVAWQLRVTGLVQGVGLRPFVHRLAMRHGLGGWVRNGTGEVEIHIEGSPADMHAFLHELGTEAPPLARIEHVHLDPCAPEGTGHFAILASSGDGNRRQPVSPDVGTCDACERELFDPANRRYRYPFITCTDCGPRFTVIRAMPYDRERTSMAAFAQCADCRAEYQSPGDRRHHSETNSCAACGPRLWFCSDRDFRIHGSDDALAGACLLLGDGGILALRGLGGFHLAVDATSEPAVARLRERKHRDAKPLAVMVRTLAQAEAIAVVNSTEAALLRSPERPIVLLSQRDDAGLAPSVAPGLALVGVMLASTPLHHLLLDQCARPLVMTSGNLSEEPIAISNEEAIRRLSSVADGFLHHDREIVARYDDSVMRVVGGAPVMLRRGRGYAPLPLRLPVPAPRPLVAVGPHLKNTFTLVHGADAWVSQHIGDLESLETHDHFRATLHSYRRLFHIDPEVAVRDAHEGYLSTRIASELGLAHIIAVQHHHAHIAAVAAEHGETGPVLGVAMDGTGAGDDGTVWGAEFLVADLTGYRRVAHLLPAPMPGGDLASRTPWRAALGYLSLDPSGELGAIAFDSVDPAELAIARRQVERRLNAPLASSMGRLFDAAAAIIGLRRHASYEGQAAMELEALAGRRPGNAWPCRFVEQHGRLVLDPLPVLAELDARRRGGAGLADLAADFHASIARAIAHTVLHVCPPEVGGTVVLGGGSFQNARLLQSLTIRLERVGLRVLVPRRLPPNDGAISYGQAAIGAALLAAR